MKRFALIALMYVMLSPSARAAETLENVEATVRYEFSWGGIGFGKIALEADETDATFSARTLIKSKGLASMFVKHSSDTKMDGLKVGPEYLSQHYDANFQTRNKKKHINLTYDSAGNIEKEISEPEDADRPKVSAEDKAGALDPLALLFKIRRKLFDALAASEKTFKVKMYDGRRLTEVQVDISGLAERTIAGEKKNLIHVILTRKALSGYTDKELERMKDGINSMHAYFSDDAQLWPIMVEVDVYLATMRGEFTQACSKIEECF